MTDPAASSTVCGTCGSSVAPAAPFCAACGSPVRPQRSAAPEPRPETAYQTTTPSRAVPAELGRRFAAYVIDSVLFGIGTLIVLVVVGWLLVTAAVAAASSYSSYSTIIGLLNLVQLLVGLGAGLLLVALLGRGASPGMRMLGLRLQRLDGGAPGFGTALGRQLLLGLSSIIIVGPLSPLFDTSGRRQGWHDRATHTWVVDSRAGSAAPAQPPVTTLEPALRPAIARDPAPVTAPSEPVSPSRGGHVVDLATAAPAAVPAAQAAAIPDPTPAPHGVTSGLITGMPDFRAPAPAPPQHRPSALDVAPNDDIDDLDLTRAAAPSTPGLRIDGRRYPLRGSALIGRDPAPRPGEQVADLLAPPDKGRSMSKTHALIEVDTHGLIWVTDRGSTNGTRLIVDGTEKNLMPAQRTPLPRGASIVFGDVTAVVELP